MLVPPDDPAALAAALRRWLGDADLRRRLRRAARPARPRSPAGGHGELVSDLAAADSSDGGGLSVAATR